MYLRDFPIPARGGTAVAGLGLIGQPTAPFCSPEPGEIADSHKDAGILAEKGKDVCVDDKGVMVADFGVNGRSLKKGTEAKLAPIIKRLENDPRVKTIRITGFDDCLKATPQVHRYLRQQRALRVRALLGPKARVKVAFAGGAPLDTFVCANTDKYSRAHNRSVRIEVGIVPMPLPSIQGTDCWEKMMRFALDYLKAEWLMDEKIKNRLALAIRNSLDGGDDSFLTSRRPGFGFSNIKERFEDLCYKMIDSTAPLTTAVLKRDLIELDNELKGGGRLLEEYIAKRPGVAHGQHDPDRRPGSSVKKSKVAEAEFWAKVTDRYEGLLLNPKSAYAGYVSRAP